MGWDAYAVRPEVVPRTSEDEFLTPALLEFFRQASQELSGKPSDGSDNLGGGTLGGLSMGILARASGIPDYDETSVDGWLLWPPDTVRQAHEQARWDFQLDDEEQSFLVTEARLFLDVCASHGLAIWYDW